MKTQILLTFWCLFPLFCDAQPTFSKIISNYPLDPENAWTAAEVSDGYIILSVGDCLGQDVITCAVMSKLDKNGNVIWFIQFDFYPNPSNSILVRNDRIYICGRTNQGDKQMVLYCLDLNGNILWNRNYGKPNKFEAGAAMAVTLDGHIVICGAQNPDAPGMPLRVVYLVEADLDGNLIAEYTYDFQNNQSLGRSIIVTTDGQVIFSYIACPESCFTDFTGGVASVDTSGNLNWDLSLPLSFQPDQPTIIQTSPNTLVTNWNTRTSLPNHDINPPALFYLNTAGQKQDSLVFENQSLKKINDLESIWGEGLVGCGSNFLDYINDPAPKKAGWIFRVDDNKEIRWDRSYTDTTFQGDPFTLQYILHTNDGGYLAVGTIINNMTGVFESHNWILKLDALGCLQPGCGDINFITQTEEVTFLTGKDIFIYPNPASDRITIQLQPDFPLNNLTLHLVSNEAKTVKKIAVKANETQLEVSGIPSGIYYLLVVRKNEIIQSKRMMISR